MHLSKRRYAVTRPDSIRGKVAIAGVGLTAMGSFPDRTSLSLAMEAFKRALDDAGLTRDDVDGLICLAYGSDYDRFLEAAGLNVRYAYQGWSHGRFLAPMVQHAAMAIHHGLADCIAIVHGRRGRAFGQSADVEMWRQGLGPHGESPAYGAVAPAFGVAISAQRYFHTYGGGSENLGEIAVALRHNASLNPDALRRDPITVADHQASPWIIEPLRRLDCCQNNDGGACLLITSAERARDMAKGGVQILGMQGVHAGPEYHNFAHVGLGVAQQGTFTYHPDNLRVYEQAGVDRSDIDSVTVYDAFSPVVLYALERFGFCGPGEAKDFVKNQRIAVGGELPVNTSGGLLSEGHVVGWNLFVEIVRQLRHECGDRQVPNAQHIQWASFLGDSIVFGRQQ
jgi:acetyl-CoA acetyltransferase